MNFLFDIGNVLLRLDFPSFEQKIFPQGIPPEIWSLKDPYEMGKISDQDFLQTILTYTNEDLSLEDCVSAWNDIFLPHPPMWELVERLKSKGHTLILFSNTNALHSEYFLSQYPVFKHFDHHHFSQEVGAIKPNAPFYTTAIEKYGLTPSETPYFDDLPENIAAGEHFGFQCHQYDSRHHQAALTWLAHIVDF